MVKKAELHVHLEGTITPELAHKLAARNQLSFPKGLIAPDGERYAFDDFIHFLSVYDTLADLIRVPQDYYDLTLDYLARNAADDVIYVEMMYSPEHAEKVSGIPSIEHVAAIEQAIQDAESRHGIVGRILVTGVRHFGADAVTHVAEQALKHPSPYITGFGLGGDEAGFPPKLFERAYHIAREAGLGCTAHAGEFAGVKSMEDALKYLSVQRIGHGVQAINSPEMMDLLKERGVALEVCPGSNVRLGLYDSLAGHPFPKLLEAGISVSLNSDDPPFFGTTVAKEYARVQEAYDYSDAQMRDITLMALDAAFIDKATKVRLRSRC
jgi:adenosine deaminase